MASNMDNPVQAAGAARGGYGSTAARTATQFNCFSVCGDGRRALSLYSETIIQFNQSINLKEK
jgi:hypothetical protein